MADRQISYHEFEAWQGTDETHKAATGYPGYRIVYKTLKLAVKRPIFLKWPNLQINISVRPINIGGVSNRGLPSRQPSKSILPSYLIEETIDGVKHLKSKEDMNFEFSGWEKNLENACYVEFLLKTKTAEVREIMLEGRKWLAILKTIFEQSVGEKLLGIPVTEEVGELFDDWHWNRKVFSREVGAEAELNLEVLEEKEFRDDVIVPIDASQKVPAKRRRQVAIACDWFWKADREEDPVNKFITLWIAMEALVLEGKTNVKLIKEKISSLTNTTVKEWEKVGHMNSLRGNLMHGTANEVSKYDIEFIHCLLSVLLRDALKMSETKALKRRLIELANS